MYNLDIETNMRRENLNLFFIARLLLLIRVVSYVKTENVRHYVITLNVKKLSEQWNDCFLDFDDFFSRP